MSTQRFFAEKQQFRNRLTHTALQNVFVLLDVRIFVFLISCVIYVFQFSAAHDKKILMMACSFTESLSVGLSEADTCDWVWSVVRPPAVRDTSILVQNRQPPLYLFTPAQNKNIRELNETPSTAAASSRTLAHHGAPVMDRTSKSHGMSYKLYLLSHGSQIQETFVFGQRFHLCM